MEMHLASLMIQRSSTLMHRNTAGVTINNVRTSFLHLANNSLTRVSRSTTSTGYEVGFRLQHSIVYRQQYYVCTS